VSRLRRPLLSFEQVDVGRHRGHPLELDIEHVVNRLERRFDAVSWFEDWAAERYAVLFPILGWLNSFQ
jgi:hypothetical protein